MELINNRYRIIKNIRQNRLVSSYAVYDIMKDYEPFQLNIFNKEYIPDSLLDYYINEFRSLANIDSEGIIKVYDFGLVNVVDNKKINMPSTICPDQTTKNSNIDPAMPLATLIFNLYSSKSTVSHLVFRYCFYNMFLF
jgi:hypothetical protein